MVAAMQELWVHEDPAEDRARVHRSVCDQYHSRHDKPGWWHGPYLDLPMAIIAMKLTNRPDQALCENCLPSFKLMTIYEHAVRGHRNGENRPDRRGR